MKFELSTSGNQMFCISGFCSLNTARAIKSTVTNILMSSAKYKVSKAARAFLQGYDEKNNNSWIFVEFWTADNDAIMNFINYINDNCIVD